ncbi:condensin complex subunit 2-like isoform X3 [Iris pallida]|uniref:Condensin complex subunit 2-like isoform X3 n=1 Tax=Iris pallida TaxID=29817 RepID=A0AAX6DM67_IRIPA|nr:condensin complex subunit 2-like isoform X3 [Iris pallida]
MFYWHSLWTLFYHQTSAQFDEGRAKGLLLKKILECMADVVYLLIHLTHRRRIPYLNHKVILLNSLTFHLPKKILNR